MSKGSQVADSIMMKPKLRPIVAWLVDRDILDKKAVERYKKASQNSSRDTHTDFFHMMIEIAYDRFTLSVRKYLICSVDHGTDKADRLILEKDPVECKSFLCEVGFFSGPDDITIPQEVCEYFGGRSMCYQMEFKDET